jgi:hypothetical protein
MSLQDDALYLAELDRRVIRDLLENNTEDFGAAISDYMTLRRDIQKRILGSPTSTIQKSDAADILRKISGGGGLPSDKVIERLVQQSDENYSIESLSEEEINELGHEIFYPWFSHYDYIQGLAELRPLILRHQIPEFISRLVKEIKECYAFQQYDAAYSMCRTFIEACIRDICVRCNLFPDLDDNVILFGKYHWGTLRDKVSSGDVRKRLNDLYAELSTLVHGRKCVSQDQARQAFRDTLEIVEAMYSFHNL